MHPHTEESCCVLGHGTCGACDAALRDHRGKKKTRPCCCNAAAHAPHNASERAVAALRRQQQAVTRRPPRRSRQPRAAIAATCCGQRSANTSARDAAEHCKNQRLGAPWLPGSKRRAHFSSAPACERAAGRGSRIFIFLCGSSPTTYWQRLPAWRPSWSTPSTCRSRRCAEHGGRAPPAPTAAVRGWRTVVCVQRLYGRAGAACGQLGRSLEPRCVTGGRTDHPGRSARLLRVLDSVLSFRVHRDSTIPHCAHGVGVANR